METTNNHYTRCKIALKDSKLFKVIDDNAINEILRSMRRENWPIRTFKNSDDFHNTHFYCIVSGRVKMYHINPHTGRYYTIDILKAGDCFDVLGMINIDGHHVYFETLDEIEVLSISMVDFRAWMLQQPLFNISLLQYVSKQMCQLEQAATDMCLSNTLTRLANLLIKHTDVDSKKLEVIHNLPNEELAGLLGTTRAVVNRNIQELKDRGAILVSRKHIEVLNKYVLVAIASSALV